MDREREDKVSVTFRDIYPEYEEVEADGVVWYQVKMVVGGRDEQGEFEIVLDGPAQGERVYLEEHYGNFC